MLSNLSGRVKYYWSKLPCSRTRHKYPGAESHPLSQSPVITFFSFPPAPSHPEPPPPIFTERQILLNLNENKLVYLFGTCFMNEKKFRPQKETTCEWFIDLYRYILPKEEYYTPD